jgi:hypothetical protein
LNVFQIPSRIDSLWKSSLKGQFHRLNAPVFGSGPLSGVHEFPPKPVAPKVSVEIFERFLFEPQGKVIAVTKRDSWFGTPSLVWNWRVDCIDLSGLILAVKSWKSDNWRLCGRWIKLAQMAGNSNMALGESHINDCRDNWVMKSFPAQNSKSQSVSGSIPH